MGNKKMRIAIVGTNGVPACYGGFETLVEHLVPFLSKTHFVDVYCSKNQPSRIKKYKGAKLIYLPFSANNWQSIIYDALSIFIACFKSDKILILGSSGTVILPFLFLFRSKFIFNFGGLDWKRSKWSPIAKFVLKNSEAIGVRFSALTICDNEEIKCYTEKKYKTRTLLAEYGADHVLIPPENHEMREIYPFLKENFALTVARIQSDNNVDMILNAASLNDRMNYVVIGNWVASDYGRRLKDKFANFKHIWLLDAIYDQYILDYIRSRATIYIHGHSAGGTNPALVEAMALAKPIIAYDCGYNRSTTKNSALYFASVDSLLCNVKLLASKPELRDSLAADLKMISEKFYTWSRICTLYTKALEGNYD